MKWSMRCWCIAVLAFAMPAARHADAGTNVYVGVKVPANRQVTMDRVDHSAWDELLRKYVGEDGMVAFAIVCASIGCPRLLNEAYVAESLDKQLETNARDFFSRSQNFRYDERNRRFYLSSTKPSHALPLLPNVCIF